MATTTVSIRMDSELKRRFEQFCEDVGMSMTTAFTIYAKKVVNENRIPFDIGREIPNEETLAAIDEVRRMKADPSLGKSYTDVDQMMEELVRDLLA